MNCKEILKSSVSKKTAAIICASTGLLLILISYISGNVTQNKEGTTVSGGYCEYLEERLESIIEDATGDSNVSVLITMNETEQHIPSDDQDVFGVFTAKADSNETKASISTEIAGVMIVCKTLDNSSDFNVIKQAVATALDIPKNKIYIIGGTRET